MSQSFEDLNDRIVYTNVDSKSEALKLRDDAKEKATKKTVVIFFENRYHLYLAPQQDPYQIRKEIDQWMSKDKSDTEKSSTKSSSDDTSKSTSKPKVLKVKW